jgi:hypothetical protein
MKLLLQAIVVLLFTLNQPTFGALKMVRGARPFGFFSDFLLVLNHLEFCKANGLTPVIYWGEDSAYFVPEGYNGSKNVWEYYFEPVSTARYTPGDHLFTEVCYPRDNNFTVHTNYQMYIKNKYMLPSKEQACFKAIAGHEEAYLAIAKTDEFPPEHYHHYNIEFRRYVKNNFIDPFIKIKPNIMKRIQEFYNQHIRGKKTVGIHLRGGHILSEVLPVPLQYIVDEANTYADQGYQFFIATDQYPLLEEAKKMLRGKVISLEIPRFKNTTSPFYSKLHPRLGEDVLIEGYLLSMTDHLIHTLSNLSSAVLFLNPELSHTLIY